MDELAELPILGTLCVILGDITPTHPEAALIGIVILSECLQYHTIEVLSLVEARSRQGFYSYSGNAAVISFFIDWIKTGAFGQAWWHSPLTLVLGRRRQVDH